MASLQYHQDHSLVLFLPGIYYIKVAKARASREGAKETIRAFNQHLKPSAGADGPSYAMRVGE